MVNLGVDLNGDIFSHPVDFTTEKIRSRFATVVKAKDLTIKKMGLGS